MAVNPPAQPSGIVTHSLTEPSIILNDLLRPERYDKRFYGTNNPPLVVALSMMLNVVGPVNDLLNQFSVDVSLEQTWLDIRLRLNETEQATTNWNQIRLARQFVEQIWIPDTYFLSEDDVKQHKATVDNVAAILSEDGTVKMYRRFTIISHCKMDVTYFPVDRQLCELTIGSYGNPVTDIIYCWDGVNSEDAVNSVYIDRRLPQFNISKITVHRYTQEGEQEGDPRFSMLSVQFTFDRIPDYYLELMYLPALLITVVSWTAFFISRESNSTVARKMGQGVSLVLTMSAFIAGATSYLPRVSYIKCVDIYIFFCFFLVVAALIQSTYINILVQRRPPRSKDPPKELINKAFVDHVDDPTIQKEDSGIAASSDITTNPDNTARVEVAKPDVKPDARRSFCGRRLSKDPATKVDQISKIVFPLIFFAFNIIYTVTHLVLSSQYNQAAVEKLVKDDEQTPLCKDVTVVKGM